MNMIQSAKDQVLQLTVAAYEKAAAAGVLPAGITVTPAVEIPKDTANGDYTTTFCLAAAKAMKMNPRQVATVLTEHMALEGSYFTSVELAGPGFLNFRLGGKWYADTVSGNLHIDTLSARSAVLRSTSGGIRTGSAVLTDSMQAGTVSGEVRIASLAATKAEVASESGDILLSLARCEEAEIDGDSSLVTLTLLSDLGATVTHHSTTGSMQTGLLCSFSSENCSVFGNGACRITVVTKSGDLRVR